MSSQEVHIIATLAPKADKVDRVSGRAGWKQCCEAVFVLMFYVHRVVQGTHVPDDQRRPQQGGERHLPVHHDGAARDAGGRA